MATASSNMNVYQGVNAGGGSLGAYASLMGAYEAARGYKYQQAQSEAAALEVERAAKYDSWRMAMASRRVLGAQRAGYAAIGVELSGTAIDVLAETAKMMTLDKLMMQRTAKIQANQHRADAKNYARAAKYAKKKGVIDAIGVMMETGAKAASMGAGG